MKNEFEDLVKIFRLTYDSTEFTDIFIAKTFWNAQQAKIEKLEHDLGNERCANRMLQYVLDKEVKS